MRDFPNWGGCSSVGRAGGLVIRWSLVWIPAPGWNWATCQSILEQDTEPWSSSWCADGTLCHCHQQGSCDELLPIKWTGFGPSETATSCNLTDKRNETKLSKFYWPKWLKSWRQMGHYPPFYRQFFHGASHDGLVSEPAALPGFGQDLNRTVLVLLVVWCH